MHPWDSVATLAMICLTIGPVLGAWALAFRTPRRLS